MTMTMTMIKRQKKVPVNRWDVVCHVCVCVEVVAKVMQGKRMDSMSYPASKYDQPLRNKSSVGSQDVTFGLIA